jgi:hypothetical protein
MGAAPIPLSSMVVRFDAPEEVRELMKLLAGRIQPDAMSACWRVPNSVTADRSHSDLFVHAQILPTKTV